MGLTTRVVLLGDLHFSEYASPELDIEREQVFTAMFKQAVHLRPDLVVALGDTTHQGSLKELDPLHQIIQSSSQKAGIPIVTITGNHDCYQLSKSTIAPYFIGFEGIQKPDFYPECLCGFLDLNGVRFTFLDTARDRDPDNFGGDVNLDQLHWLQALMADFNQDPKLRYFVLMGHHPLFQTTAISDEEMMHIANSQELMTVLETLSKPPGLYCCGHNHTHSIARIPNWLCIQTAAPLDCRGGRLLTLDSTGIRVEPLELIGPDAEFAAAWERIHLAIPDGFSPQTPAEVSGSELDRTLVLSC